MQDRERLVKSSVDLCSEQSAVNAFAEDGASMATRLAKTPAKRSKRAPQLSPSSALPALCLTIGCSFIVKVLVIPRKKWVSRALSLSFCTRSYSFTQRM